MSDMALSCFIMFTCVSVVRGVRMGPYDFHITSFHCLRWDVNRKSLLADFVQLICYEAELSSASVSQ